MATVATEESNHVKTVEEPAEVRTPELPVQEEPVAQVAEKSIKQDVKPTEEPSQPVKEASQPVEEEEKEISKPVEEVAKPVKDVTKAVEEPEVREVAMPVEEPVKIEEVKEAAVHREITRDTKRDSKVSTMSKDSTFVLTTIAEEGRRTSHSSSERKQDSPSMTRTSTMDESMPPTPISLKPSRSTQIQGKLNSGRKSISRKLKRAFSVSTSTASSKKRFTL